MTCLTPLNDSDTVSKTKASFSRMITESTYCNQLNAPYIIYSYCLDPILYQSSSACILHFIILVSRNSFLPSLHRRSLGQTSLPPIFTLDPCLVRMPWWTCRWTGRRTGRGSSAAISGYAPRPRALLCLWETESRQSNVPQLSLSLRHSEDNSYSRIVLPSNDFLCLLPQN